HAPLLHRLALAQHEALVVDHDPGAIAAHDRTFGGEVQRHHVDVLAAHVTPHIQFGPVGQREYAHALAFGHAGVEQVPQLGPLPPRVPAVLAVAEGEHALLGARFLLVAAGAADGGVVAAGLQRL